MTIIGRNNSSQTYRELMQRVARMTAGLSSHQIGPGDRVGVPMSLSFDVPVACGAVWSAGAALVPLPPSAPMEGQDAWRARLRSIVAHTSISAALDLDGRLELDVRTLDAHSLEGFEPTTKVLPTPGPNDLALVHRTSGTTGDPKALVTTYRTLAARVEYNRRHRRDRSTLAWFPPHTSTGFNYFVTRPLTAPHPAAMMDSSLFKRSPARWLIEIARLGIAESVGPVSAFALAAKALESGRVSDVDLSCWTHATCGGESIDGAALRRFAAAAAPFGFTADSLRPAYGMSEVGAISMGPPGGGVNEDLVDRAALASGNAPSTTADDASAARFVSLGPPEDDVDIRIVDDMGGELGDRLVGGILVRCPRTIDGYLDEEATKEAFVDGWFRTGDLGYMADGELYITGRIKDVIIVKGRTLFAEDIERVATAGSAVEACAAISLRDGLTEGVLLVCETSSETEMLRRDVVRSVWSAFGVSPRIEFIGTSELPRNPFGKVVRRELAARFAPNG